MNETRERIEPGSMVALGMAVWEMVQQATDGEVELYLTDSDAAALVAYVDHVRSTPVEGSAPGGEVRERIESAFVEFASCLDLLYRDDELMDLKTVVSETAANFAETLSTALLSGSGTPPGEGEDWRKVLAHAKEALHRSADGDATAMEQVREIKIIAKIRTNAALRSAPSGVEEGEPVRYDYEHLRSLLNDYANAQIEYTLASARRSLGGPQETGLAGQAVDAHAAIMDYVASLVAPAPASEDGYWWCPECREEVDASRVTYQELHDTCGTRVESRAAPVPAREGEDWTPAVIGDQLEGHAANIRITATATERKEVSPAHSARALRGIATDLYALAARLRGDGGGE